MEQDDQGNTKTPRETREERPYVSREELYAFVWAEPMVTVPAPRAFERRIRTVRPPMLVWAIMRTV